MLGGFTTMSAAAEESRALLAAGDSLVALAYVALTLTCGLLAVVLAEGITGRDEAEAVEEGVVEP